ncbi:MAG: UvrD-helicase domain-containing protein [Deltaproteobacteria bacterium]|nr:UvrD-helicase domain-containing protein [Deltaproteobacteria bacterium]
MRLDEILFPREPGAMAPPDQAVRRRLIEDLDTSFFVEAGAGSGKTACMSARLVSLAVTGRATCGDIAAVTFSRKAAAEMRQRFQTYLELAARNSKAPEAWRSAALRALSEIDRAFVGTIHAFCARLLRERPVESGLPPDFVEIEEEAEEAARSRAWEEFCLRFPVDHPGLALSLSDIELGIGDVRLTYDNVCAFPEVSFPDCEAGPFDAGAVAAKAVALVNAVVAASADRVFLVNAACEVLDREMRWLLDAGGRLKKRHAVLGRLLEAIAKKTAPEKFHPVNKNKEKSAGERGRRVNEAFGALAEFVAPSSAGGKFVAAFNAARYLAAIRVARLAADHYRKRRAESGTVNFADLLLLARNLLRDNDEVRGDLSERFKYVLVDEFQDTDPLQAEVLAYLCADDPKAPRGIKPGRRESGAEWKRRVIRTGALMVVGDPKQSIYRFRRADIEVFNAVRAMFERSPGCGVVSLGASFRAQPAVAAFVNSLSGRLFEPGGTRFQAQYEEMRPVRIGRIDPAVMTCTYTGRCGSGDVAEAHAQINRRVVRFLRACRAGKLDLSAVAWKDFLVLTMRKDALGPLASEMNAAGIPVEVTGAGDLADSIAASALLSALAVVSDPDDEVALVGLLRGPLFGISDRELYAFGKAHGKRSCRFSFFAPMPEGLDSGLALRLGGFFGVLRELRTAARGLPPAAALGRIVDRLEIRRLALASETPMQDLGGLEKILELARGLASKGSASLEDIATGLAAAAAGDADSISLCPGRRDAARLMNLHKAKGLEGRVVVLAGALAKPKGGIRPVIVERDAERGWVLVERAKGERGRDKVAEPPVWAALSGPEEEHTAAEQARLQYVAATRAKDLLVVCRAANDKGVLVSSNVWSTILDAIGGTGTEIPEIAVEPETPAAPPRLAPFSKTMELTASSAVPGRDEKAFSELEAKPAPAGGTGLGPEFGTAMHTVLQAMLDRGAGPTPELARNALTDAFERDPEPALVDALLEYANGVPKTKLWQRILKAEERFTEVPMGAPSADGKSIHLGRADLLFKDRAGWVLVDFKTDVPDGRVEALKKTYGPQLDEYARIWQNVTGEEVAERYILFTSSGEAVAA